MRHHPGMDVQKFVIIELNIIVNKPCIVIFLIKIQNFVWWEHFHLSSEDLRWPEPAVAVRGPELEKAARSTRGACGHFLEN